jgi:hypothetical protein
MHDRVPRSFPMPIHPLSRSLLLLTALSGGLLSVSVPASAQPGWGHSRLDGWRSPRLSSSSSSRDDSREGKVQVEQFAADDAAGKLGHGPISVASAPGTTSDASDTAACEAAVVDQLVKVGYDTVTPDPDGGQIVELRIVRDVLVPEEQKRKPVSGEMTVGASNYGTFTGMAIAVDLTKPHKALLSTRLEARVKDRATGAPLWEGRATIATRDGSDRWTEQAIATRLAAALFEHFRETAGAKVASR